MEKDETILTDISENENALIEKPVTPMRRGTSMQAIVDSSLAAQQEPGVGEELPNVEEHVETVTPLEPGPVDENLVDDKFVTVKINGKTSEVSAEKVERAGGIEAYQRTAAASIKQNEVAAREAEVQKREEDLAKLEADIFKQQQEKKTVVDDTFGKAFADEVFENPDAVAEKVNQLQASSAKAEEVAAQALARADALEAKEVAREEKDRQSLVDHFWNNHEEIATDPVLTFALNSATGAIIEENPTFTQHQVVDAAAKQVYEKYNLHTVEPEKSPPNKPPKTPPKASSRSAPKEKPKIITPQDVVRQMASGRAPMRH